MRRNSSQVLRNLAAHRTFLKDRYGLDAMVLLSPLLDRSIFPRSLLTRQSTSYLIRECCTFSLIWMLSLRHGLVIRQLGLCSMVGAPFQIFSVLLCLRRLPRTEGTG